MSETKCGFLDDAAAYWDGELEDDRRIAFEKHLGQCGACRRELAAASRVDALLRAADPAHVRPARHWRVRPPTIALAAAASILVLAWLSLRHEPSRERIESRQPDRVVAVPSPAAAVAVEIRPPIEDWATFRGVATEALAAFDDSSGDLSRLRRLVGLSPRVLAEALPDVPDESFARASRAVIALAGAPGVRAVVVDATRRDRRGDAARALAAAREGEPVEAAVVALQEWMAEPSLRTAAIDALGAIDHPAARASVATVAREATDDAARERAREALAATNLPAALGALAEIGEQGVDAPAIRELLAARPKPLMAWFRRAPATQSGSTFAAEVLAATGEREAVDRLLAAAAAGDGLAGAALAQAGDGAVPRLRESLRAPTRSTRTAALDALAVIPGRAALDGLLAAVSQGEHRETALDAISKRGDADAVTGLVALLRRGESERLVIATIVKIGDPRAIPALENLRAYPTISGQIADAVRALRAGRT